uniref:Uncharacterized protein n=1 Tax=Tetradesmus obliquus TaxID=3088 RepID=A0A383VEM8_TETOB|eukprot:jgi/Sobl393_1/16197/SZX64005.1
MSGNHYSKQVMHLEAALQKRMAQLRLLEAENARLKQKEWALQSCILGIKGSVAATKAVLEVEVDSASAGGAADPCYSEESGLSCSPAVSGDSSAATGSRDSAGAAAQNVLVALERKEQQVQDALSQMGCCSSSYSELYGVRLLRRATTNPAVATALLNTPLLERRQYVKAAMQKLGLLLPKYDSAAPSTSLGCAKERLHAVLDDLAMRILLTTLMDPPAMRCSNMLVNLETMETETYPEDYWTTVAERVHATLTDDQKAALKTCWSRVKANKAALTAQHNQLSTRLEQLQQLQQQHQQKFEEQAAQLPLLQVPQYAQRVHFASQQQQQQQWQQPQQQQTQQAPVAAQDVQQPGSMQVHQLEEELQEVERLLFSDLDVTDLAEAAATPTSRGSLPAWSPDEPLSGLLQEQHAAQQACPLAPMQPQVCVLPAVLPQLHQQQEQQQQQLLLQGNAQQDGSQAPQACQLSAMPQQPQLLLQDQQPALVQVCVLPPVQNMSVQPQMPMQQLQMPVLQQPAVPHPQQCSQVHMRHSSGAGTSSHSAGSCHQQLPQQPVAGSAAPELASLVAQPDGSFSGVLAATAAAGARDSINNSMTKTSSRVEEVLLPVASKEQRKIERQLLSIAEKIKLQHFCQILQFHNTLSNKQMAELYVSSWPFLPDSLAVCEALDELGW